MHYQVGSQLLPDFAGRQKCTVGSVLHVAVNRKKTTVGVIRPIDFCSAWLK
jgi:hypothetical protein